MPIHISKPSVQSLHVQPLARGLSMGHATAVVAQLPNGQPFLLTNRHVVRGRDNVSDSCLDKEHAALPDTLRVGFWARGLSHQVHVDIPLYINGGPDDGGEPAWFVHPSYPNADVAALELHVPTEVDLMPYPLGITVAEDLIEPSDHVQVIGFPLSGENASPFAIWVAGFVASEPELNQSNAPFFLIDCRARSGQSGSPVVVATGGHGPLKRKGDRHFNVATVHLLGLYSGRLGKDSDLGMVWKAWLLTELLIQAAVLTSKRNVTSGRNC